MVAHQAAGDLDQEAGAVTALAVGVEAAAMGEPGQGPHAQGDRFMAELGRGDKAHAAGCPASGHVPRPGAARRIRSGGH